MYVYVWVCESACLHCVCHGCVCMFVIVCVRLQLVQTCKEPRKYLWYSSHCILLWCLVHRFVHIHTHIYSCVCVCTCVNSYAGVWMCGCLCLCVSVCLRVRTCMRWCTCACMWKSSERYAYDWFQETSKWQPKNRLSEQDADIRALKNRSNPQPQILKPKS